MARLALSAALALAAGACTGTNWSHSTGEASPGVTAVLWGDWDDVEAAVQVAAGRSEMAIVHVVGLRLNPAEAARVPTRRCVFELRTAGDEPVRLEFRAASTTDPGDIVAEAHVGRYGDRGREEHVLAEVRRRLADLAGVDWAPIRE